MQVEFQVFRQLPPAAPRMQSFQLDVSPETTILDCLTHIKWEHDGSLAFRKNCRNTICGSCAMRINGRAALACKQHVDEEQHGDAPIVIAPLGNLPVMKDLIVDMTPFWRDLERVDPFVKLSQPAPDQEFRQSPEERDRLTAASGCISCGACYSDCNAKEVNPDFVGPHALAKASRLIQDSRDDFDQARLEAHNSNAGVWGCTRCLNCNFVCPMDVKPLDRISTIKQEILARDKNPVIQASRAIRHRKTLIELVRQSGWIDERRFGLTVVANQGLDLGGFTGLLPLGLRMVSKGKFPFRFHASKGSSTVRKLIDNVRRTTQSGQS